MLRTPLRHHLRLKRSPQSLDVAQDVLTLFSVERISAFGNNVSYLVTPGMKGSNIVDDSQLTWNGGCFRQSDERFLGFKAEHSVLEKKVRCDGFKNQSF
jgi:hypothetical protein